MSSHNYNQAPYAPPMYPEPQDNIRPVPPVRAEFEEQLLPPVPRRMDKPDPTDSETRNQPECSCNYNRYATKKTIGQGLLEFALITSNAMQLRTLISQKQRDGIWIASLILVCLSIFVQLGLAYLLIIVGKGDIQKPHKQPKLERYNNLVLFVTLLISVINVIINGFMSTTSTNSYLDTPSIELLAKNKT